MKMSVATVFRTIALTCATTACLATGATAQQLSKAEQIYADLAKLAPEARLAKMIEGAKQEGQFRFVHSLRGKVGRSHTNLFQKRYPFLKVELSDIGSQDAAERMVTEESAGRHLTDAIVIELADGVDIFDKKLAARYPTPETARILPSYKDFIDPENRWVPFVANEHGMAYNTNLVKDPPKTYEDLCDARFKGKTSFDPLETRFLVGMYRIFGNSLERVDKWLECIGKNEPLIQRGHTQRIRLMISGDHAISPDQYLWNGTLLKKKNPETPYAVNYSTEITLAALSLVINKNTPYPYATALFADWTLSQESQEYLAATYRGPVAAKHPYFPDNAKLISYTFVSSDIVDKLHASWQKHIRSKK